ncbi:hypothetical protein HK098_002455 [Nowakowskiella sp. JEL0407]|nr:hypothetical protein HK098_002455 [Nowakowskiella sp. JEL0407]
MDPANLVGHLLDDGTLRITDVIGSGSFATVYLAESTEPPKRQYAVKSLFKSGLTPLQLEIQMAEARFLTKLSPHPNIVVLHKVLHDEEYMHLVMEFAPSDLFEFVADVDFLDDETIKDLFLQIVSAVKHCHNNGVYHRDLKPENILVAPMTVSTYQPKLTDFGLATHDSVSSEFGCGSVRYLAPECLPTPKARPYIPARADIWALGVILVNLISGKNPWRRADDTDESFICYHSDTQFWDAFGITPQAAKVVSAMLSVNPAHRISLDEVERRIMKIEVFREKNFVQDMGDRETTVGTVGMEREHRSWNSFASEMSFGRPLVFRDAVVPDELRIQSPTMNKSWHDDFEDDEEDKEYVEDYDDGIMFPPMSDDEEELFAKVLVHGQVPSFVNSNQMSPVREKKKKKRGNKNTKRPVKIEFEVIESEPHDNSVVPSSDEDDKTRLNLDNQLSTPIAIPRQRKSVIGEKTPTGRHEIATMTEEDDEHTPPAQWGGESQMTPKHYMLAPESAVRKSSNNQTPSPNANGFAGLSPTPTRFSDNKSLSPSVSRTPPRSNNNSPRTPMGSYGKPPVLSYNNKTPVGSYNNSFNSKTPSPSNLGDRSVFQSPVRNNNTKKPDPRVAFTRQQPTLSTSATKPQSNDVRAIEIKPHNSSREQNRTAGSRPFNPVQNYSQSGGKLWSHDSERPWTKFNPTEKIEVGKGHSKLQNDKKPHHQHHQSHQEWKKQDDWKPMKAVSMVMEYGWDKAHKKDKREWKRKEVW